MIKLRNIICFLVFLGAFAGLAKAEEPAWLSPEIGPFSPSIHFNGAVGDSSGDVEELAAGHHDPSREDGSVQGLELATSLRLGQLEGFATYVLHYGAEEEWEDEWEEAFLKVKDLPGGLEVRGGRVLGRYGKQNSVHLHSWQFVDMPLALGRFLGDDGLIFDGGDVTWAHRGISTVFGATVAYGEAKSHDHDHAEEGGHEEHGDEHGEEHEEEHGHEHAEEVLFADDVTSGRLFAQFRENDFHQYEVGLSAAVGDDEAEREIAVYGLDFTYTWRENGLEPEGRALVWTTELLYRDIEDGMAHDHGEHEDEEHEEEHADEEHEEDHSDEMLYGDSEFGLYSQVVYTFNTKLDAGLRVDYVEGSDDLGTDERVRISPAVTTYLDPYRRTSIRLQYNYDDLEGGEEEHTVWAQLGLTWGGTEVR